MKKVPYIYFLLLIPWLSLLGQKPYLQFEYYTSAQGLSQNSVYAIIQDKQGFMWFATQDGLNRFDGYGFKIFRNENHLKSTASNYIYSMAGDAHGRIWIGTTTGLAIFDPKNSSYTDVEITRDTEINQVLRATDGSMWVAINKLGIFHFSSDGETLGHYLNELVSPEITFLYEDNKKRIWAGSANRGISIYNPTTGTFSALKDPALQKITVSAIRMTPGGEIWIGSRQNGLLRYRESSHTFESVTADGQSGLSSNNIKYIFTDSKKRIWIASEEGLNLFNEKQQIFYNYNYDQADPNGLSNDDINFIFEDRSGALWIAMNNTGICRYSPNLTYFKNYDAQSNGSFLPSNIVWSFYEDDDGELLIGTENGLTIYNPRTRSSRIVNTENSPLSHNTIRHIHKDKAGFFWLASDGGGLIRFDKKTGRIKTYLNDPTDSTSLSNNRLRYIFPRDAGSLWVATLEGLNIFNFKANTFKLLQKSTSSKNSLSDDRILSIYQYRDGPLFIGTYNGLSLYNEKTNTFRNFHKDKDNPSSISSNIVISVLHRREDPEDVFWVGTSEGLNRFNLSTGEFKSFTTRDGLPNNIIYSIEEDRQGHLWMATNKGLSQMDVEAQHFRNFNLKDGLRNDEFSANASIALKNGQLWFGGVEGITAFTPEEIGINENVPPIAITSFSIYDKELPVDSILAVKPRIDLSYTDKFFKIQFAALEFTNPLKNRYKYKLEGFDSKWIDAGYNHSASYTNLDGGEYVFRVIASNNDGVWNEKGLEIPIYIKPPFWETVWFIGALISLVLLGIAFFVHLRLNAIKRQREELKEKVRERTAELLKRNVELKRSQAEQKRILHNVEEGFFLLDSGMKIQSAYSKSLETILEDEAIAERPIFDVLAGHIGEKEMDMTRDYLNMLFEDTLDEELIASLNPLNRIKTIFKNVDDTLTTKYLDFRFKRITEFDKISGIIATVSDVTEEHLLGIKLAETEAKSKKQMEWMLGILHIEPHMLIEFNESAHRELDYINTIMAGSDSTADYPRLSEQIARSLHLIKGNANLLNLEYFANMVHRIEEKSNKLCCRSPLSGSDFIPVFMDLDRLKKELNELGKLIERMARFSSDTSGNGKKQGKKNDLIHTLRNYADKIASEMGLRVHLKAQAFQTHNIPLKQLMVLKDIFIQLVRNSLSHGIEPPEERRERGKQETGTIEISVEKEADSMLFIRYTDDGRGLQYDKIKQKACTRTAHDNTELEKWSKPELAELIFEPGFTSKEKADMYSGRGMGMDLVRDRLKKYGGGIEVESKEGEYCTFIIKLSLTHRN